MKPIAQGREQVAQHVLNSVSQLGSCVKSLSYLFFLLQCCAKAQFNDAITDACTTQEFPDMGRAGWGDTS